MGYVHSFFLAVVIVGSAGTAGAQAPVNDDCADATVITSHGTYPYDNTNATTDGSSLTGFCDIGLFGGDDIYNDVWFRYTPEVGGCTYISTYTLAGYDTRIAIYDTSFALSSCPADPALVIACSDEEVIPLEAPFEAGLDVELIATVNYLIRIGNYDMGDAGGPAAIVIKAGPIAENQLAGGAQQTGSDGCGPFFGYPQSCNGDGGNQMGCTVCPCGNDAVVDMVGGCVNSSGRSTRILPSGSASVSLPANAETDLRFGVSGAPAGAICILSSGDGAAPSNMANPCFGMNSGVRSTSLDGLRCAVMNVRRHGTRAADMDGKVGLAGDAFGGEGSPADGIALNFGYVSGQTRYFQVTNVDNPLSVCLTGLNTSQLVEVTFQP